MLQPALQKAGVEIGAGHVELISCNNEEPYLVGLFPRPAVMAPLYRAGIGVEVMDTRAACRTYNILQAEGRQVLAAIIVDPAP